MNLERFLRETKEKHVLIANGDPKELFVMLSAFILNNKVLKVIQEIEDFPISIIIDCEVFINVSKR